MDSADHRVAPAVSFPCPTWILEADLSDGHCPLPAGIGVDLNERSCALAHNLPFFIPNATARQETPKGQDAIRPMSDRWISPESAFTIRPFTAFR
jgi:hypothetical protein